MPYSFWQKVIASLLFVCVTLSFVHIATAEVSTGKAERVILVVIDKLTLQDYEEAGLENVKKLTNRGALGLLNNNTGAGIYSEHTYPTIGGGAHLIGTGDALNGFNPEEETFDTKASNEYIRRTGFIAPNDSVIQLALGKSLRNNYELNA